MAKSNSPLPPIQQRSPELKKIIEEIPRKLIIGGALILIALTIMIFSIAASVNYPDIFEAKVEITDCSSKLCEVEIKFGNSLPSAKDLADLKLSLNACESPNRLIPLLSVRRSQDQIYLAQISLSAGNECALNSGFRAEGDIQTSKKTLIQRIWQNWTED